MTVPYPSSATERTRWILERRGARNTVRPAWPYAFFVEEERSEAGTVEQVATVFLTNKECPWKCLMCDLWQNTTEATVNADQIVGQIEFALAALPRASTLKIYNSGSFFDPAAVPPHAWGRVAALCRSFRHLIVECHPRLIGPRILEFLSLLPCSLEIAVGLETAHPSALEALNKRITSDDYIHAAAFLRGNGISLRTFLLVHPPFVREEERERALENSIVLASRCGSDVVSLIPLRPGNGAIDELITMNLARPPSLRELEEAHEISLRKHRGRSFADAWDLQRFSSCRNCFEARKARIERMNLTQSIEEPVSCAVCGNG